MARTYDKSTLKRLGGPQSGQIVDLVSDLLAVIADCQAKLNALVEEYNTEHTTALDTSDVPVPTLKLE